MWPGIYLPLHVIVWLLIVELFTRRMEKAYEDRRTSR